jgi:hypothetical protein
METDTRRSKIGGIAKEQTTRTEHSLAKILTTSTLGGSRKIPGGTIQ